MTWTCELLLLPLFLRPCRRRRQCGARELICSFWSRPFLKFGSGVVSRMASLIFPRGAVSRFCCAPTRPGCLKVPTQHQRQGLSINHLVEREVHETRTNEMASPFIIVSREAPLWAASPCGWPPAIRRRCSPLILEADNIRCVLQQALLQLSFDTLAPKGVSKTDERVNRFHASGSATVTFRLRLSVSPMTAGHEDEPGLITRP